MQSRLPWSRVVSKPHSYERKVQRRILIVDDDVDFAASLADLLEPRGYEVTTACEPEQALQLLSTSDPSIVMVDIRLGRHSGVEFLPRLLAARPELICIMITAYGDMGTAISALRRGAYDYYEKSSDPAELYAIMDRAFEKCELRRHARETEQKLQEHKRQLDTALNNMSHGLCMFDVDGRLVLCNERYREMYGLSADEVKSGISLLDLLERRKATGNFSEDPAQYCRDLLATIAQGKSASYVTKVGTGREVFIVNKPMADGGWVATHEDISERRQIERQIEHMALHDALTDLPNRVLLRDRLEHALASARRGEQMALLYLDLDQFKNVNDTLGHPVGDQLLKEVAARLRLCVREIDAVARIGGDEFAIIQAALNEPTDAATLARRVREAITAPYDLAGHHIVVDTSIGIAIAPNDGCDPDQLLKSADMALYGAKADGRATYRFFEPAMDARVKARRTLERDLRRAYVEGEFESYYQPIFSVESKQINGVEALLRWKHPLRGLVLPGEFIPVAEEIGLINQIGEWILRKACAEVAGWPIPVKVAVNLSPLQLRSNNLVQAVINALAASGLPPERLELEITEAILIQETEKTLATLHQLRALGVRIAMDDFGTGYSSLSYLRKFPFDKIKIDRCFISGLSEDNDSIAIVKAVSDLATSLRMTTTAEGVETQQQLEAIQHLGCGEVQGYLFSAPKPAEDILRLLIEVSKITARAA
jgi:diguanylate cyclase (GGDEF)-like protein/PAS domain S-box-containing protein